MAKIQSINPSTYEIIGEVEMSTESEIKQAVNKAKKAQQVWAGLSLEERIRIARSFLDISKKNKNEIARLIAEETGRPFKNVLSGNVEGGFEYFESYLENAPKYLSSEIVRKTNKEIHEVIKEPWGVVACICPWNYPYMNVVWQCIPALLAGNTVIYKNSEENPLFAKYISELMAQTEFPDGVFNFIYGDGDVGNMLINQDVDMISFTGSAGVGKKLAAKAGEKFIPIIAELGGSSPAVIFDDVKIDKALAEAIFGARFLHSGQICNAIKRVIVYEDGFEPLVKLLSELCGEKKLGNALDDDTDLGPLVAERQVLMIEEQVKDAVEKGATIVCGGKRPEGLNGAYYEPTIITGVKPDMRIWNEETFGPVLPIVSFKSVSEALKLANDTQYGLGAHVFTNNEELFNRAASEIKSGIVAQNNVDYFSPESPFGGYKDSGIGRMHGQFGFDEVTQVKLIAREI